MSIYNIPVSVQNGCCVHIKKPNTWCNSVIQSRNTKLYDISRQLTQRGTYTLSQNLACSHSMMALVASTYVWSFCLLYITCHWPCWVTCPTKRGSTRGEYTAPAITYCVSYVERRPANIAQYTCTCIAKAARVFISPWCVHSVNCMIPQKRSAGTRKLSKYSPIPPRSAAGRHRRQHDYAITRQSYRTMRTARL